MLLMLVYIVIKIVFINMLCYGIIIIVFLYNCVFYIVYELRENVFYFFY